MGCGETTGPLSSVVPQTVLHVLCTRFKSLLYYRALRSVARAGRFKKMLPCLPYLFNHASVASVALSPVPARGLLTVPPPSIRGFYTGVPSATSSRTSRRSQTSIRALLRRQTSIVVAMSTRRSTSSPSARAHSRSWPTRSSRSSNKFLKQIFFFSSSSSSSSISRYRYGCHSST